MKEQRQYAITISGGCCEVCGEPLGMRQQMAHRIGNTQKNRKLYGDFIVDHKLNVGMTCSLECNGKLDISNNPKKVYELCRMIYNYELGNFS